MSQPFELVDEAVEPRKAPPLPIRIVQVFTSPARLFDALKERPLWLGALLVLIGLSIATQLLVPEDVQRAAIESQMERFIPDGTDPAEVEAQIDSLMDRPPTFPILIAIVFTPAFMAFVALILLLAFNVVMGGEARFKQLFSASVHAGYVYTFGGLLALGLMFMGSEEAVLTPGLFLPPSADGFFAELLNGINVFSVWTCVTLGIAVSRIYPKRSVAAGTMYLLSLYLLLIVGSTMLTGFIA